VVDVRNIGGGLPVLPGTASSFELASVPEASVSMSAALRGAKNFRVTTTFGGMFKAVNVLVCTVSFFEVPPVSWVARLFCLRTSWKPSYCVDCCSVTFGEFIWSASVLALSRSFNSSKFLYKCHTGH
jgi:hypothetical protein